MKVQLHAYQLRGVEHVVRHQRCALFWEMGVGKTLTVLTAIEQLLDTVEVRRVLVVAPLRVAISTWPDEIDKWDFDIRYTLIRGAPGQRRRLVAQDTELHLINFDNLKWLVDAYEKRWPYDMVVFDESSKLKAPGTKRFRSLRRCVSRLGRVVLLSGTPSPNGLLDLWSQLFLLDGGLRLGKTFTAYKARFFYKTDFNGYKMNPRHGSAEYIHEQIKDLCLSMRAEDYLELPERVENQIPVFLGRALDQYQDLERRMALTLNDTDITAVNAAVLMGKLLQFASGALYDEERNWHVVHDEKLDALGDIIDEAAGTPVLVAYNYQSDLERLKARFKNAVVLDKHPATIECWNRGEISILLAHPQSAGHGLNLQMGGNIIAWFSLTWSLEALQQFNARLHRQGQKKPVFIHYLVAEGTVDETVLEVLHGKDQTQRALMLALRDKVLPPGKPAYSTVSTIGQMRAIQ